MLRIFCLLLFSLMALPVPAQTSGGDSSSDPKDALGWFERASDQMNLRALGSAPFHMKVKFHAFPGVELLPPEKSEIVTGDGVYEETWLSPNQWRREVTLGSYHAVETHTDRVRKMQASSDYEPSRVLMLMDALLNPISRDSLSPDLQEHHIRWKMDRSSVAGHFFVRISASSDISSHITFGTAYVFLPGGLLLQSNENDIVTTWQDDTLFAGKFVPEHISIQASATRDLLTAEVKVEEPGKLNAAAFDLPGAEAQPGMTLRPLHRYEITPPEETSGPGGWVSPLESYPDLITHGVTDRHGIIRELEIIYAHGRGDSGPLDNAQRLTDAVRQYKFHPAQIDGSPCETAWSSVAGHT